MVGYYHAPSKRTFNTPQELAIIEKAWKRRLAIATMEERRKRDKELLLEMHRKEKIKEEKRKVLKDQIKPLIEISNKRLIKRQQYVSLATRDLQNQISDYETQIKKLQQVVLFSKKSLVSYTKEAREEFDKKYPFKEANKLKNLRSKLYKL